MILYCTNLTFIPPACSRLSCRTWALYKPRPCTLTSNLTGSAFGDEGSRKENSMSPERLETHPSTYWSRLTTSSQESGSSLCRRSTILRPSGVTKRLYVTGAPPFLNVISATSFFFAGTSFLRIRLSPQIILVRFCLPTSWWDEKCFY